MRKPLCRCASPTCKRSGSLACERRVSRRLRELARDALKWAAEAKRERLKQLMLNNDLTQRYIIIEGTTRALEHYLGAPETEKLVRGLVPAPFVRTLGPLQPIFAAMLKNEERLNALPPAEREALLKESPELRALKAKP